MHPPHPYLKLRTYPGRFEVWLEGWERPIARAQELHDGTWVAAVRPLQSGPERAVIVESEAAALERLQPWCREHAWTFRPNAGNDGVPVPEHPVGRGAEKSDGGGGEVR